MKSTMRRVTVIGLTGTAVIGGVLAAAGVANAGTTPHHHPATKTNTHHHPAAKTTTIHHHTPTKKPVSATTKTFATKRAGAQLRSMANTGAASHVVSTLGKAGTKVTVSCYVTGQPMGGDHTWYRTTTPAGAYIPGSSLRSGHDPAAGIKHC
ncbi:hypothetical protein ACQP2P_13135 [Dactylosporangium sp. CA-139114]|uniref:hypothetical protein n=1 Tax=Dactylosporangium sp. CA-139114 TaxID=3239931 RepID=UPI003D96A763